MKGVSPVTIVMGGIFAFLVGLLVFADLIFDSGFSGGSFAGGEYQEVKWDDLVKLDPKTGKAPPEVEKLDGQRIRMPGFVVPLADNFTFFDEFLLVPNAQACIHVPPPPPNMIVHVKLDKAQEFKWNPVWVTGVLKIETKTSQYGSSSYYLEGDSVRGYNH